MPERSNGPVSKFFRCVLRKSLVLAQLHFLQRLTAETRIPPEPHPPLETALPVVATTAQFDESCLEKIPRAARSVLPPAAQPLENLIYRLLCAIAGLSDAEARGLEDRLAHML